MIGTTLLNSSTVIMDNWKEFYSAYISSIRAISRKTMENTIKTIDENLLEAGICWMVTDNMFSLLALSSVAATNTNYKWNEDKFTSMEDFMREQLNLDRLLIFIQDYQTEDHWFAIIGDHKIAHIIEHTTKKCNAIESMSIEACVKMYGQIKRGYLPERYIGAQNRHYYEIFAHDRKSLSIQTIDDYLNR